MVPGFILQEKIMSEMTFSEDSVWALGLSFFPAVPIYQRRDGPIIMANASELPPRSRKNMPLDGSHLDRTRQKENLSVPLREDNLI